MAQRVSQWSLEAGVVRLEWPEPMTPEDLDDVEAFLALAVKGIKRRQDAREANPSGLKPDAEAERETTEKLQ